MRGRCRSMLDSSGAMSRILRCDAIGFVRGGPCAEMTIRARLLQRCAGDLQHSGSVSFGSCGASGCSGRDRSS